MKIENFFNSLRQYLLNEPTTLVIPKAFEERYDSSISQTYITLFEPGRKPLRWGTKKKTLLESIVRIVNILKSHPRFTEFSVDNEQRCRIMLEFVTESRPCNIRNLTTMKFIRDRFEPGVTGLKATYKGETRFFMPTDAVTHSIMSVKQLLHFLSKRFDVSKMTDRISQRVHLMRRLPIEYHLIYAEAYITYEKSVVPLTRGIPPCDTFSEETVLTKIEKSLDWLVRYQREDGSFLYYYDPILDSEVDFLHPKQTDPLYNNILRHSGGTVTLLKGYEKFGKYEYLESAKSSIDFFVQTLRSHTYNGEYACYPFFNQKSKLGGAGIGLVALMLYYRLSGDDRYMKYAFGLVRHLLSRIDDDGEMLGYYIHPLYNEGNPIESPDDSLKQKLFSFYYPGEALLGLALFYHFSDANVSLRDKVAKKSRLALDFLIDIRPVRYNYLFEPLPSDAWLMQAIESWADVEGFIRQSDVAFVYNEAQQMFDHMYQRYNTSKPIRDYIGGFYYQYGDHVYHDASRNEGIVAAYFLAKKLGDEKEADYIMTHMLQSAEGLMLTYHSEASSYAHRRPEKSVGTFRFKLTRQWIRVDSVQHAACFFLRLCDAGIADERLKKSREIQGYIDRHEVLKLIDKSGFSDVYLVKRNVHRDQRVLKKVHQSKKYAKFIERENTILKRMKGQKGIVGYDGLFHYSDGAYFLFEYIRGKRLNRYARRQGGCTQEEAKAFLETIVSVLQICKAEHILHLDLKPANVMYDGEEFYLIDWGLAREGDKVVTSHLKGNPIYFAPETFMGYRTMASEVYALGCSLYEMFTGERIFGLRNRDSLVKKIYYHLYVQPSLENVQSAAFRSLIRKMLEKDEKIRIDLNEIIPYLYSKEEKPLKRDTAKDLLTEDEMLERMVNDAVPYALLLKARELLVQNSDSKSEVESLLEKASTSLPEASALLGILYFERREYEKAYPYLLNCEETFEGQASYYLWFMYHHGLFVEQSESEAQYWLLRSFEQGYRPAERMLEQIEKRQI